MKKNTILTITLGLCLGLGNQALAQYDKAARVMYKTYSNGKDVSGDSYTELVYANGAARIQTVKPGGNRIAEVPKEATYIDFGKENIYQMADLYTGKRVSTVTEFAKLPKFEVTSETETILGFKCKKAKAVLFSNTIEVYFTEEAGVKGSPQSSYCPNSGLVLKVVRNGNSMVKAEKVEYLKKKQIPTSVLPASYGDIMPEIRYRSMVVGSYIKTVDVFTNEQICWGSTRVNPSNEEAVNETFSYAGGTVIMKKVKLPKVPQSANAFVELVQYSNGDAYDRTGSIFIVPTDKKQSFMEGIRKGAKVLPIYTDKQGKEYPGVVATPEFSPIIELMRFFTSFGVKHFNGYRAVEGLNWRDSSFFKQDVTELLPALEGEVWVGAFIGNYDKGGHKVSLKIKYHLNETEVSTTPEKKYWIKPIFATINVLEMGGQPYSTMFKDDSLRVKFDVPKGVKNVSLRYITTGHGGWGNGDEFVPKRNELFLDGKSIYSFTPWRTDCGTYREYNPASGNFWNGISSSDLSRSGWCPGTLTNPVYVPISGLSEGMHEMKVYIPLGEPEGSSFSHWCLSGVLVGEIE